MQRSCVFILPFDEFQRINFYAITLEKHSIKPSKDGDGYMIFNSYQSNCTV